MASLTGIDILVLLLLGGGALWGWLRGFVREVLSLFAWVAVVFALKVLEQPVSHVLQQHMGKPLAAPVLAFVLIGGIVYLGGRLCARSLGRRTQRSVLGPIDRVLGAGFGALKALIAATLVFLGFSLAYDWMYGAAADRPAMLRDSRTFPLLNASGRAVVTFLHAHRADAGSQASPVDPKSAP